MTERPKAATGADSLLLRLVLYPGELYRLPGPAREIRVLTGNAWLTVGDTDIFLSRGEKRSIPNRNGFALISALGTYPLILELRGQKTTDAVSTITAPSPGGQG